VLRYQTEIDVPPDRYVCLQLPADFPEGRATVTVAFHEPSQAEPPGSRSDPDPDREDIEWWEEFDEDAVEG
jgi:hypothetical protein